MTKDTNLRGIILMIASMAAFAAADTMVKLSTSVISPAQILFFLISGAFVIFFLMACLQGEKLWDTRALSPILLLRYLAEIAGMVGMVMALAKIPISVVGAVTQATPLLTTVGAVLFLNEGVGWRRWCSIIFGFVGVVLIVQPGAIEFDYQVLWATLALVSLSVRDLTTRLVPEDMTSTSLATFTMAAALPFTVGWVYFNGESLLPVQINWLIVIPMVVSGAIGYMLLIASIRIAEVSIVMPFRYTRIIFLLGVGVLIFQEKPDTLMLIGVSLIIVSGIYMMWREQLVKHIDL